MGVGGGDGGGGVGGGGNGGSEGGGVEGGGGGTEVAAVEAAAMVAALMVAAMAFVVAAVGSDSNRSNARGRGEGADHAESSKSLCSHPDGSSSMLFAPYTFHALPNGAAVVVTSEPQKNS